jgi:hypothetical protein
MRRWIRVIVPVGLAAVLVSVLAIGFGSPSSLAAKPRAEPTSSAPACNAGMNATGHVSPGAAVVYETTFCSDPGANFYVWLSWGKYKPDKDLALVVTAPDGLEYHVDHHNSSAETLTVYAPLSEGTWSIEVVNNGSRNVNYDLTFGFK